MKIVMLSPFFPLHGGGIEVVAGQLVRRLGLSGCHVDWFASGGRDEIPGETEGVSVRVAPAVNLTEKRLGLPWPIWSVGALRELYAAINRADVVHAHDYIYMPTVMAYIFCKILKKPFVITQHIGKIEYSSVLASRTLSLLNRTLGRFLLGRADEVFFVSPVVRGYFSTIVGRPIGRFLPNGVDRDAYGFADKDGRDQVLRVVFVGRFVEKKGIGLLNECLDIPGVSWVFLGQGPLQPKAGPAVRVINDLRGRDVVPWYQWSDVLVLPSKGEGFPLVVQEALSCGTSVLISEEVAEAFETRDAKCVFTVDLKSRRAVDLLRQTLTELRDDVVRLREGSETARELSMQWSWEEVVASCMEAYVRSIEGERTSADITV